jgi:hypothetical protein
MPLFVPEIEAVRDQDPLLYTALQKIVAGISKVAKSVAVNPSPAGAAQTSVPAPEPPLALVVTATAGVFQVLITPNPDNAATVQYYVDTSPVADFSSGMKTYPLGSSTTASLNLGDVALYFRAYTKYPDSDYSDHFVFGGAVSGGFAPEQEAYGPNLLLSGGGQNGNVGSMAPDWNYEAGAQLVIADDFAKTGSRSLKLDSGSAQDSYSHQDVAVSDGRTYMISAWIKNANVANAAARALVNIDILSGATGLTIIDKKTIGSDPNFAQPDCGILCTADNDFTFVWCVFRMTGTGILRVFLQLGYAVATSGRAWFDNVVLQELATRTLDNVPDGTRAAWDSVAMKQAAVDTGGNLLLKNVTQAAGVTDGPTITSSTPATIPEMTKTITTKGNKVLVIFAGMFFPSVAPAFVGLGLYRDGSLLTPNGFGTTMNQTSLVQDATLSFEDTPGAGSHTYEVKWNSNGTVTVTAWHTVRYLQVVELG